MQLETAGAVTRKASTPKVHTMDLKHVAGSYTEPVDKTINTKN